MTLRLNIERMHITEGAKFKTEKGIVWIIDEIDAKGVVRTSMEHGAKGNYRDDIQTVIAFLNEEKAVKIN